MKAFKQYFEQRLLLESVYADLKGELENDTYHEFIGGDSNAALVRMLASPAEDKKTFAAKLLFQIYVAALIVGISEDDIKQNPDILLDKKTKDIINKVFEYYDKNRSIKFYDEFRHLTRNFTVNDYLDVESPGTRSVIEKLTNDYGEIDFDPEFNKTPETTSADV